MTGGFPSQLLSAVSAAKSAITQAVHVQLVDALGNIISIHDGHLKMIGYHASIGHGSTNGDVSKEFAAGDKEGIAQGAFTLVEREDFVQPVGDTQMYAQSSSAQDAAAGTGAQEITIEYFTFAWVKKTQVFVPTGLSQVTLAADFYRLHSVIVTKGLPADGDITITDIGETALYGQVHQFKTYMERCIFYVETGKIVTSVDGVFGCTSSGGVQFSIFASEESASGNVVARSRIPFKMEAGTIDLDFELPEAVSNPNGKRIAIGVAVTASTGAVNQKASAWISGYTETI